MRAGGASIGASGMRIAIVTFDGFNEIDSFVTAHILNRVAGAVGEAGVRCDAEITCPTASVTSMNGVRVAAQRPLEFAAEADAVVIGSGSHTREIAADDALMARLRLDPSRQLVASQCSGALVLARLGLLRALPACTDLRTRPFLEDAGVRVLDQAFFAAGNLATAGGCLSAQYLSAWIIWRLSGRAAMEAAFDYVWPVHEREPHLARLLATVGRYLEPA
jgi:transcriptional regulator GlxA family with amidase domain